MANGYWNKVLHVDLETERTWVEEPGDAFYRKHMGGRSFIAHYLLTEVPQGIDAFDPRNRLIFATGVVTGAPFPGAGRHSVGAKSPLNNGFGEGEAGGFWGAELKKAGWDAIVIQGKSAKPTYLWISDDKVEFRDASHLWGKITGDVEDALRAELGDRLVRVTQIGPAGENLVRFACVVNDLNEVAGRPGLGAVMGSKLLKAIVVRGSKRVPVANSAGLQETAKWVATTLEQNHKNFHEWGTGAAIVGKQLEGHMIVRNFRDGQFAGFNKIDALAIKDTYRVKMDGCFACSVRCKKRVKLESPWQVDPKYGGPEYETIGALGTNLAMDDLAALCKANEMTNYLGVDSISCGVAIGWAIEMAELGLLTEAETDGVKLEWGNGAQVVDLIEKIAYRRGLGDLLAEGTLRAAQKVGRGTEQYVVHVKGLEVAMHDPRGMKPQRRNYPLTPTGGDHTGGADFQTSIRNTIGLCIFLRYDADRTLKIVRDVTGWDVTAEELDGVSKRGLTMARMYNLREGKSRADDRLPWRLHQPISQGPLSNYVLPTEEIDQIVTDYYVEHGWDAGTGAPTPATLDRLGLASYTG